MAGKILKSSAVLIAAVILVLSSIASDNDQPKIDISEHVLKNGLRVVISEDHAVPIAAVCITYDVGSLNERPGRTGFAHLFEHLMFRGSENVGSGQHGVLVHNVGGDINGTTGSDRTNYYEYLPAHQLELALYLEADRMRALTLNQENLTAELETVKEERRMRQDNQPYGTTFDTMMETAYKNFAYGHSGIGSMEDLNAATLEDAQDFFRMYYAPNNAVLSIVGDIRTKKALKLARKYFEKIPSGPPPPPVDLAEPEQIGEKRKVIDDPLAPLSRLDIAFHIPPDLHPDTDAAAALAVIFNDSIRAPENIVRGRKLAVNISAFAFQRRGPGLFYIQAMAAPDQSIEDLEQAVYKEIEALKSGPIADWEIESAVSLARRRFIAPLSEALSRATLIGEYTVYYQNPGLINTRLEAMMPQITLENIQKAARKYLIPNNRTVVITRPAQVSAEKGGN